MASFSAAFRCDHTYRQEFLAMCCLVRSLVVIVVIGLPVAASSATARATDVVAKPNIVFIVAADLRRWECDCKR